MEGLLEAHSSLRSRGGVEYRGPLSAVEDERRLTLSHGVVVIRVRLFNVVKEITNDSATARAPDKHCTDVTQLHGMDHAYRVRLSTRNHMG
jgi:hypothetical protein